MKLFAIATSFCMALCGAYACLNKQNNTVCDLVLLENIEALSSSDSPNSSWYQYMDYSHPCKGYGMKMYCSSVAGTTHCTFHCGKNII